MLGAFLGAGSVLNTSRAFVVVVLGFFCSVCRDERNESIAFRRVLQRYCCSGFVQHFCALGLAAIDCTRLHEQ